MSTAVGHLIERDEDGNFICSLCDRRFAWERDQTISVGPVLPVVLCASCLVRCEYNPASIARALVDRYRFLRGLPLEQRELKWMRHLARVHVAIQRYAQPG